MLKTSQASLHNANNYDSAFNKNLCAQHILVVIWSPTCCSVFVKCHIFVFEKINTEDTPRYVSPKHTGFCLRTPGILPSQGIIPSLTRAHAAIQQLGILKTCVVVRKCAIFPVHKNVQGAKKFVKGDTVSK